MKAKTNSKTNSKTSSKTNACDTCMWKNKTTCTSCSLYYKQDESEVGSDEK